METASMPRQFISKATFAALILCLPAQPSLAGSKPKAAAVQPASVKQGVEAWSRGDYAAAVKLWRDPAVKGDADAQYNMAQAYKLGRGVKADLNIAADWYRQAASRGHFQAADSYGHLLHYQGKVAESLPYLQQSADRGEARSQYLLATELFNGNNTSKDWVRAYALMTRASSSGLAPASRSLAQMDQYIPIEQRQQGTNMAAQLEKRALAARSEQVSGFPIDTSVPPPVARPIDVPPSGPSAPGFPGSVPENDTPVKSVTAPKQPARPATPRPPAAVTSGKWRIQLGAFGTEANATKLWNTLESRVNELSGVTPYLVAAGKVTRLQAGPFTSRGSADSMCNKVKATGQGCLVIPG
jgi:uncharacterized protein